MRESYPSPPVAVIALRRQSIMLLCAGVLAGLGLVGCKRSGAKPPGRSTVAVESNVDSTAEMAALLRSTAESIQPGELPFYINPADEDEARRRLELETDPNQQARLRSEYVIALLSVGKTEQALTECKKLEQSPQGDGSFAARLKAMCYLRMAEEQNCCSNNTPQSCLIPIRGSGLHTRREGSLHAMETLLGILKQHPDDQQSRWLLAIAAMTIGKYPDGVPANLRIDPKAFQSDYDIKRFPNIASQVGLNLFGRSGGVIIDDLDGDGYLDIMISGIGFYDPLRFFHNNGDATFTERRKDTGLTGITGGLNLLTADYDNDGRTDILVLRGGWMGAAGRFPCSLLHNDGNGKFTDVTKKAGLLNNPGPTQTAVWLDYNLDGLLDLYIGYEGDLATNPHPCVLYRNNGDGTFTDVTEQAGVGAVGTIKAVVSADYDKDGWPDLLLTSRSKGYILYHNNGNGTFTDVTAKAGIKGPQFGFSSFFFDFDNDGWPDIFLVDYPNQFTSVILDLQRLPVECERSHLYHNNHDGTFTDVSHAAHVDRAMLGMGINFGDLDNDGWLDFYVGTGNPDLRALVPNRMWRNAEGRFFQEVTTSGDFGHLQKGHGVAFGDINNDGQQDVFEEMGGAAYGDTAYSALFANPGHPGHWITLKLEGTRENRSAIGARIKVTTIEAGRKREIYRTVGTGGSFGCNPLRQEIGLGRASRIESVEIYWPVTRKTQTLTGLQMDRFYHIKEGSSAADPVNLRSTPWSVAISHARRSNVSSLR